MEVNKINDTTVSIDGEDYLLNEEGAVLDKEGNVKLSKEELDTHLIDKSKDDDKKDDNVDTKKDDVVDDELEEGTVLEIGDDQLTITKDGSAIDKDGKVVYTKAQVADVIKESKVADDEVDDDAPFKVEDIITQTNIKVFDEQGQELSFENTPKGIASYVTKAAEQRARELAKANENALLQQYPVLSQVIQHLNMNNGSLEDFKGGTDYTKITLDKNNKEQLKNVIYQERIAKGDTPETAREIIKYYEDENKLFEKATPAKDYLVHQQTAQTAIIIAEQEAQRAANIEQEKNHWGVEVLPDGRTQVANVEGSIYDKIVNKGTLKIGEQAVSIPEVIQIKDENGTIKSRSKKDFFNYLYALIPVQDQQGNTQYYTQYELDQSKKQRTIDEDLYEAFKTFTKANTDQLIKETINKQKVIKIKAKQADNTSKKKNVKIDTGKSKADSENARIAWG